MPRPGAEPCLSAFGHLPSDRVRGCFQVFVRGDLGRKLEGNSRGDGGASLDRFHCVARKVSVRGWVANIRALCLWAEADRELRPLPENDQTRGGHSRVKHGGFFTSRAGRPY